MNFIICGRFCATFESFRSLLSLREIDERDFLSTEALADNIKLA